MSDSMKHDTLCERCSLLSFDDLAIGGQEVVDEDGVARLFVPESQIETRPLDWPWRYTDYALVRLDWKIMDTLPGMPQLSHSSQLGCVFCQALLSSLYETLAEKAESYSIYDGTLTLVAYLSLIDRGINTGVEGLLVEVTDGNKMKIQMLFPIEADGSEFRYPARS